MRQRAHPVLHFKGCLLIVRNPWTWQHETTTCSNFRTSHDSSRWSIITTIAQFISFIASQFHPHIQSCHFLLRLSEDFETSLTKLTSEAKKKKKKDDTPRNCFHIKCFWKCFVCPCIHLDSSLIYLCIFSERQTAESFWYHIHSRASEEGKSSIVRDRFTAKFA